MGGSSKKVTVGYKYYLGMHFILCHGPADRLVNIKVDGRVAWKGASPGGRITLSAPSLFGGEEREGGVSGEVDIEMGALSQTKNDYLQTHLGTNIPAFRGVVGAVLRQCYLGMNPYIKPWAFRLQRILKRSDGTEQWYPERAPIPSYTEEGFSICFCIDQSGSMLDEARPGVTRMDVQVAETASAIRGLASLLASSNGSIGIVGYGLLNDEDEPQPQYFSRYNVGLADVEAAAVFVENLFAQVHSDTDWEVGMSGARAFFESAPISARQDIIFLTDGNPTRIGATAATVTAGAIAERDLISNPSVYCISIDLGASSFLIDLDNTAEDGVPSVSTENSGAVEQTILSALAGFIVYDMNPAHIIRESLVDLDWGMGYLPADINEASFIAAADQLFNESMGISILWDRQIPIEDFIKEIIRHIDAALYVDRYTGQFTLKLIRDDYDEESLLVLGPENIQNVSDYKRVDPGESINSVTVNFWNSRTGTDGSVTIDEVALIQAYGAVVNTVIQYPGFTNKPMAAAVATRDLQALSAPLLSCTLETNREASDLNIGSTFKFEWPDYHDGYIIMRVHNVSYGDGRKNRIKISAMEDVFSMPLNITIAEETPGWEDLGGEPLPSPEQLVFEAPYYEMIQALGDTQVTETLATTPEVGYLQVAASRPANGLNARVWVDSGAGYEDTLTVDFCPSAVLDSDIGIADTAFVLTGKNDLDLVVIGTHAEINGELVRVDSLDTATGEITVGRAILDTIPKRHPAGTTILFWDEYTTASQIEYVSGESVNAKLLTNSGQDTLALSDAVAQPVVFDSRAIRPYRPGNFRTAGLLDPDEEQILDFPVTFTWADRNRLFETSGNYLDWTAGSITPEPGTSYDILVEALDLSKNLIGTISSVNTTALTYDVTESDITTTFPGAPYIRVTVSSLRDGYSSYTAPQAIFPGPFQAPEILSIEYADPQSLTDITTTVLT